MLECCCNSEPSQLALLLTHSVIVAVVTEAYYCSTWLQARKLGCCQLVIVLQPPAQPSQRGQGNCTQAQAITLKCHTRARVRRLSRLGTVHNNNNNQSL
jgi:hypothetical protein